MKTIKKLCNDIVWIHDQNQNINTITISVFFRTGTYYESDRNYGISHLTEHLFFRRLDQLPQKEVYHLGDDRMRIKKAFNELDSDEDIVVSTFREGDDKGAAARTFYKKFGFVEGEQIEEFGYPCQVFTLHR